MTTPPLNWNTKSILKLQILDEGTRRIPLSSLWDFDEGCASYTKLIDIVFKYCPHLDDIENGRKLVTVAYTDEEGDVITISSDQELEEAFLQFVNKIPSVVRATVNIRSLPSSSTSYEIQTPETCKDAHAQYVILEQRVSRLEEQLAKISMQRFDKVEQPHYQKPEECTNNRKVDEGQTTKVANGNQVHVSSTDKPFDHPMINFLANIPELHKIFQESQKQGNVPVVQEKGTTVIPTKVVATKATQVKPKAITKAMTGTNNQDQDGSKKVKADIPLKSSHPKEFLLDCFNPDFIHGRHTCDGCFTTPIMGYRFHAVNLPDYDLCYKCFKNYKGKNVLFQPEELERDRQLQSRWKTRGFKNDARARSVVSDNTCANAKGCQVNKTKEVAKDFFDAALNEAIRRSLMVVDRSKDQEKLQEPQVQEVKGGKVREAIEVEDVMSECSSMDGNSAHEEDVEPELHIPVAPTHSPELHVQSTEIPTDAQPKDTITVEMEMEDSNNLVESKSDEDKGKDTEDDVKSICSCSTNDWQVVDENSPNYSDFMVAQAAQLIGSALFQSDMASDQQHLHSGDSVTSGLTSVPSLKSKSEISAVLLKRWEKELRQLHELGFLDDHANVDALGYLEAANIGVDSNDPITINAVVDYLLKQKNADVAEEEA